MYEASKNTTQPSTQTGKPEWITNSVRWEAVKVGEPLEGDRKPGRCNMRG